MNKAAPVQIEGYVSTAYEWHPDPDNPDQQILAMRDGNVVPRLDGPQIERFMRGPDASFAPWDDILGETRLVEDSEGGVVEQRREPEALMWGDDETVKSLTETLDRDSFYNAYLAERRLLADRNLLKIFAEQGVPAEDVLMVAVTGDKIGFYDTLQAGGAIQDNAEGWQMATGYNAMFARASERGALGARAADCSMVKGWAQLPDGDTVMLLVHLTRPNIEGDDAFSYGENGDQSYIQAVLAAGAEHYGIKVEDFHLEQMARVDKLDYTFKPGKVKVNGEDVMLTAEEMMDNKFRGWFDQGWLHNTNFEKDKDRNPEGRPWKRGDPILPTDEWVADYADATAHLLRNSGAGSVDISHAVDTGDVRSGHASNAAANDPKRPVDQRLPDARDAYMVIARKANNGQAPSNA